MSSVIPEYGTREYSLWRMQVTADTLRRFVNVSDSNVSRALRHVLASDVYSGSPRDDSDEHVLQRIARNINAGRLAVFDRPLPGHAVNQWLCPPSILSTISITAASGAVPRRLTTQPRVRNKKRRPTSPP